MTSTSGTRDRMPPPRLNGRADRLPLGNRHVPGPAERTPTPCTSSTWPARSRPSARTTRPTSSSTTPRSDPQHVALRRRHGDAWTDVSAKEFLDRGHGESPKGLIATGIEVGRPRRGHEQDPLRVDRRRLRALHRRRRRGSDLRDLERRAGAVDHLRLRRPRGVRRDRRSTSGIVDSVKDDLPSLEHVWSFEDDAVGTLTSSGGADVADADVEARRTAVTLDDLASIIYTSGTTGSAEGLRAHPPLLRRRGRRAAGPAVGLLQREHLDAAVPADRARLRPRHRDRLARHRLHAGPHART